MSSDQKQKDDCSCSKLLAQMADSLKRAYPPAEYDDKGNVITPAPPSAAVSLQQMSEKMNSNEKYLKAIAKALGVSI